MKILLPQPPTAEQLLIIAERKPGVEVIRGAAGSGKTMTALLRLKNLTDLRRARHVRLGVTHPVRVLVLTYNRTLKGYVEALAASQATGGGNVELQVDTFGHWALEKLAKPNVSDTLKGMVRRLATKHSITLDPEFLQTEIEYVLGKYPAASLANYLTNERTGRGTSPRVDRRTRATILDLIREYKAGMSGAIDWDDVAILAGELPSTGYDVVVVDEAQDFSANQLRAVIRHLGNNYTLTLVIDTMQRVYPRGYTWPEVGIDTRTTRFYRLKQNHRNTVQIARFAGGIIEGVSIDDDGTMPDLSAAARHGRLPVVLKGKYNAQVQYAIDYVKSQADLVNESVAFLKPLGGTYFDALREALARAGLRYEELSRVRDWPSGPTNIALCTMHSAKGLEFDHVIILGLNAQVTPHGPESDDHQRQMLQRLLAMAAARARTSLVVGYKPGEASSLVSHFKPGTFEEIDV